MSDQRLINIEKKLDRILEASIRNESSTYNNEQGLKMVKRSSKVFNKFVILLFAFMLMIHAVEATELLKAVLMKVVV